MKFNLTHEYVIKDFDINAYYLYQDIYSEEYRYLTINYFNVRMYDINNKKLAEIPYINFKDKKGFTQLKYIEFTTERELEEAIFLGELIK